MERARIQSREAFSQDIGGQIHPEAQKTGKSQFEGDGRELWMVQKELEERPPVSVQNNDVANIMLQAYSPETKLYEDKLKILGPLCLEEGFTHTRVAYLVVSAQVVAVGSLNS